MCELRLSLESAVCVADGSCVTIDECHCKLSPEFSGELAGSYPPGTIMTVDCMNW